MQVKCRYCKRPLEEEQDIKNEYHASCHTQVQEYQEQELQSSKRLHYLNQLKEYLDEKEKNDKYRDKSRISYIKRVFRDYYKYLLLYNHGFTREMLDRSGVIVEGSDENDIEYLNGAEMIIEYNTASLRLPDFFKHIPGLKLIIIHLNLRKDTIDITYRIPLQLQSKCIITLTIMEPIDYNKMYIIKKLKLNSLFLRPYLDFNNFHGDLNPILKAYSIEKQLEDAYYGQKLEEVKTIVAKRMIYGNLLVNTFKVDDIEHIFTEVDLFNYSQFKNLKYLTVVSPFKIEPILQLQNLEFFELNKRDFKWLLPRKYDLENAFYGFYSLKYLQLSIDLEKVPESIRALKSLQVLYFYHCTLFEIPEWLGELHKLEILSLRGNHIETFPVHILDQLPNLRYLDLRGTRLSRDQLASFARYTHIKVDY